MSAERSERDKNPIPSATSARAQASVVHIEGDSARSYPMYKVTDLSVEGAFLAGSLFLEVGETVVMELSWDDGAQARASVRVVALERGEVPGISIVFTELDEPERNLIKERAQEAH